MWFPNTACAKTDAIHFPSLPAIVHVCRCLLGFISHQARNCARQNGPACDTVPCAHQHIHVCQVRQLYMLTATQSNCENHIEVYTYT